MGQMVGMSLNSFFDSFRIDMEQGSDQVNLKRDPLCGKLQINKIHKNNTPAEKGGEKGSLRNHLEW